jgi:cell division protein FtsL
MRRANTPTAFSLSQPLPSQKVVLQVDVARQLDYRRWLLLGLVVLAAALFDGWQRSAPLSYGYRLEELQRARAAEEARARRLQLEIATLESPALIEQLAVRGLHLVSPGRDDQFVIERVVPPPPPPSSVVASR